MQILRSTQNYVSQKDSLVAIGNFDGLHLGHDYLLKSAKNWAIESDLIFNILTFEPHPLKFFINNGLSKKSFCSISNLSTKMSNLLLYQPNHLILQKFNDEFSALMPEDFIEKILIKKMNVKRVVVGYDFKFGKCRNGDIELLKKYSDKFELKIIPPYKENNLIYSSSKIREHLIEGKIEEANKLLTNNFQIIGRVGYGQQIASKLGFPTANIYNVNNLSLRYGVYKVYIKNLSLHAIANYGIKPTLNSQLKLPVLEVHIPKINKFLYGTKLGIEFIKFIRCEKKFSNVEELKQQINKDIEQIYV